VLCCVVLCVMIGHNTHDMCSCIYIGYKRLLNTDMCSCIYIGNTELLNTDMCSCIYIGNMCSCIYIGNTELLNTLATVMGLSYVHGETSSLGVGDDRYVVLCCVVLCW